MAKQTESLGKALAEAVNMPELVATPPAPAPNAEALAKEVAQLKAINRNLEARLASLTAKYTELKDGPKTPPEPVAEDDAPGLKTFVVSVQHNPPRQIRASDRANAKEKYLKFMGIISTPHEPEISELAEAV